MWRIEDSGKSWLLYGNGMHAPYMPPDVEADPNPQHVHSPPMCISYAKVMWVQHHAGVYRSVDGGVNFTRLTPPLPNDFGFVIVADPVNPLRAWVAPALADSHRYAVDGAMCVKTLATVAKWPAAVPHLRFGVSARFGARARPNDDGHGFDNRECMPERTCRGKLGCVGITDRTAFTWKGVQCSDI